MGKVIAAANQKGGVGKSTIIINLAVSAHYSGKSVCILDADHMQASIVDWANERSKTDAPNIPVYTPTSLKSDIEALRSHFDYVFVDTPGSDADGNMRQTLSMADMTLIPIEPSILSVNRLSMMLKYVTEYAHGKTSILLSKVLPNPMRLGWADLKDAINASKDLSPMCPVASSVIYQRVAYVDSLAKGMGVVEYTPESTAAMEIGFLLEEINGYLAEVAAA